MQADSWVLSLARNRNKRVYKAGLPDASQESRMQRSKKPPKTRPPESINYNPQFIWKMLLNALQTTLFQAKTT